MFHRKNTKNKKKTVATRSTKIHFVILYGLVAALAVALVITTFFVWHLWQERDRAGVHTTASLVADALEGLSRPVEQISTDTQVLPSMRLTMPYAGEGILQHKTQDVAELYLTVDWATWKGSLYGAQSSEALFAAIPRAQKCSVAYIIKNANNEYVWRDDVAFTEINRHVVADGRTLVVLKNTEAECEEVFHFDAMQEDYAKIETALSGLRSY